MGGLGDRMGGLETGIGGLGGRMGGVENLLSSLGIGVGGLDERMGGLETGIHGIDDTLGDGFEGIYNPRSKLNDILSFLATDRRDLGGKLEGLMNPKFQNIEDAIRNLVEGVGSGGEPPAGDTGDALTAGQEEPFSGEEITPEMHLPEFSPVDDYSQLIQHPLIASALANLTAPDPYDRRREEVLEGENAAIDAIYDEKYENMMNSLAVTGKLGTPMAEAQVRKLGEERARAKLSVVSDFGREAAGAEQGIRTERLRDVGAVLEQELGRQSQRIDEQRTLRGDALDEYYRFLEAYTKGYYQPEALTDEGLRMLIGGGGTSLSASEALSGAVGAGGNAVGGATANTGNLLDFLGLGDLFG